MGSSVNETFQRIQREIQDTIEREEELKKKYSRISNGTTSNNNNNEDKDVTKQEKIEEVSTTAKNGFIKNGNIVKGQSNSNNKLFQPNTKTKGVMHKFLKMRGKLASLNSLKQREPKQNWIPEITLEPPRVTSDSRPTRNGYVSAEEKMKREVQEFQKREQELRQQYRQSQPNLMALLESDDEQSSTKSSVYVSSSTSSSPHHLKSAYSLADLCNTSEDELEAPGTLSLIRQFEQLKTKTE